MHIPYLHTYMCLQTYLLRRVHRGSGDFHRRCGGRVLHVLSKEGCSGTPEKYSNEPGIEVRRGEEGDERRGEERRGEEWK